MPLGDEFDARGLWRPAAVCRRVLRLAPTPEGRHSDRMEMRQVRYFLAVVDTLNLTRAAEQCHASQPAPFAGSAGIHSRDPRARLGE